MSRSRTFAKFIAFSSMFAATVAAFAIDIPVSRPQEPSIRAWDKQVQEFWTANRLAGTVIIGAETWTPEKQAAEPARFAEAIAAAQARINSAEYQEARREAAEQIDQGYRAGLAKKDMEDAEERARRLANLNFKWQALAGWKIAGVADIIRINESEAAAAAAMSGLKVVTPSSTTVVPESPGEQAQRLLSPERKVRWVRPAPVKKTAFRWAAMP